GLALFLAGFSTAASNPVTIAYFAAALVPIGRITALEGKSNLAIILIITGAAALFWTLCAALMARPTMRRFVQRREGLIRGVAALLIAAIALPMLLGAFGLIPATALSSFSIAGGPK
ncbi:MAG: hypothetical protein INF98_15545, partial [Roseomonas sp.]|nr:hypothetical protein [Roseomonas sp.]